MARLAKNERVRGGMTITRVLIALFCFAALVLIVSLLPARRHEDRPIATVDILRSSLRDMAVAQELHYAEAGTYTHPDSLAAFSPREDVVVVSATADSAGWAATLRHTPSGTTCTVTIAEDQAPAPRCTP